MLSMTFKAIPIVKEGWKSYWFSIYLLCFVTFLDARKEYDKVLKVTDNSFVQVILLLLACAFTSSWFFAFERPRALPG